MLDGQQLVLADFKLLIQLPQNSETSYMGMLMVYFDVTKQQL
jgi:hypothetical protein